MKISRKIFRKLGGGIRRLATENSGVSAVEFALLTPVIMIMLLGLVDYGLAMFHKMELVSAVRAGSQYALLDNTDTLAGTNTASIQQAVVDAANLTITTGDVTVTVFCECDTIAMVSCASSCAGTTRGLATVSATYIFSALFIPNITMTGSNTVRID
ncbi:MAG: pilus assembly protein [Rhodospirillaceae bacterium]|jgi:Flp pilus assembly protein TadG|nr:pilus assembly protein [Rhodospirillaceae bacterium]MBT5374232.1 pilus assembly protein [Rhodospirillaceae bacterium]MBT5659119.1 pilus assembly protein [Rhodospirillaceae bacterium]MBT5751798.1 pilus assembly protein [Rhodospirillaceae bacterium]